MDRSLTGSILLGSGVLSHILARWANQVAFSSSILLTVIIWGMVITGFMLLGLDFQKEIQDFNRRERTVIGVSLGVLLIVGILSFLGLKIPPF